MITKIVTGMGTLVVAATFCVAGTAMAQNAGPEAVATQLAANAKTNPVTMEVITSLTTDVGPRQAGSESERRGAAWAKALFEKYGFDKVAIESFPLEETWMRGAEKAEVTSPAHQPLVITALGGSVPTPPEGIEAEIALFRTYEAMLAAPTNSLKGKIAVVTQSIGRGREGVGYGVGSRLFRSEGPSQAARRGAIAYLLRSVGTDSHRLPHTGQMTYAADAPKIPCAALSAPDAMQLDRLAAKGPVRVKLLLTPKPLGPGTSQNVVADLKGREKPDEYVIIGAHLDSWDLGTGALDDGAGVAIVTAAAKLIKDLPQRPKRSIRVVLFGSEEIGLFGGKAYAEMHKADLQKFIVVAEPDSGQGPISSFQTGVANPDDPSLVTIRKVLASIGIEAGNNSSRGSSDVEHLVTAGVPAASFGMGGGDYFDFHHTPDDTLDKIDPTRINQCTAAYVVFTYLAAEMGADYRAKAAK